MSKFKGEAKQIEMWAQEKEKKEKRQTFSSSCVLIHFTS